MTETQKAKLTAELARLKKEHKKLIEKLYALCASNKAAWESYGSELCAGDMTRRENELLEEANSVEAKINVLSHFLKFGFSEATEKGFKSTIARAEKEANDLQEEKRLAETLLATYALLHSVIDG